MNDKTVMHRPWERLDWPATLIPELRRIPFAPNFNPTKIKMTSSLRSLRSAGLLALAVSAAALTTLSAAEVSKSSIRADDKLKETELPALAKISAEDAIKAALAAAPGKVLKVELEAEDGGLVYSVEIVGADKVVTEVEIDAGNGKVLDIDREEAKDHEQDEVKEVKKHEKN